ncbi:hypothetical protein BD770DRAFT_438398 [Pilaira anomala]|nr:hypothetical protein BD770DRAFT_438398 [Pilaira anomala]
MACNKCPDSTAFVLEAARNEYAWKLAVSIPACFIAVVIQLSTVLGRTDVGVMFDESRSTTSSTTIAQSILNYNTEKNIALEFRAEATEVGLETISNQNVVAEAKTKNVIGSIERCKDMGVQRYLYYNVENKAWLGKPSTTF